MVSVLEKFPALRDISQNPAQSAFTDLLFMPLAFYGQRSSIAYGAGKFIGLIFLRGAIDNWIPD
jgi:hypothetical protein